MSVRALSMRQPWLYAVTDLGKRVENRVWATRHRGRFLLHASKRKHYMKERAYYDGAVAWMLAHGVIASAKEVPPLEELTYGRYVATATLVDVVHRLDAPDRWARERWRERFDFAWWMEEQYGLLLERVEPLATQVEGPGALQFFPVPDSVIQQTGAFAI